MHKITGSCAPQRQCQAPHSFACYRRLVWGRHPWSKSSTVNTKDWPKLGQYKSLEKISHLNCLNAVFPAAVNSGKPRGPRFKNPRAEGWRKDGSLCTTFNFESSRWDFNSACPNVAATCYGWYGLELNLHKHCSGMRRWHGSYCQPSTVFPRMFFPTYLAFRSFSSAWGAMTPPLAWAGRAVAEAIQNLLLSIVFHRLCYFFQTPLKLSQRPSAFANGASFALSFAAPGCCCHPETHPGRWSLNRTRPVFPWAIPGLARAHNPTVTHTVTVSVSCGIFERVW